ncbi:PRA1 family protein H isoform X2 [Mercurialis annua]|uniref:PRA1 family protein H isoform X2 n=1 Tax=Mercurialis annua TaxID=3986 RepID=UPI00215FD661|nr:PRA1 family protein H isoform X2 [Mercurialis annua]
MVFSTNPLSLSVPDPAFESWLRESGYLELLDQRSSSSTTTTPATTAAATSSTTTTNPTITSALTGGLFVSLLSHLITLLSLLTLNPLSKLTTHDFSGQTPSWTRVFIGDFGCYSFPSTADQARLRVHENVKRYARNYASLFILFFACALYQMPLTLIGLISSLALWDIFKFSSDKWGWERYPVIQQVLIRTAQCATAVILVWLNVQMALFCALCVSYTVMILHAAFRKLTPAKQPSRQR